MNRVLSETIACALVVCAFYMFVWWLLGSRFFGLTNWILIAILMAFVILDIGTIHYLIRHRVKKENTEPGAGDEV